MTSSLLTTADRDAIVQMQLFARGVVEGLTAGHHRSPHKGASVEFKEHRQYVAGDEIRTIDWKLFGKTDRLFVRQYEDETNLRALIVLDQSGSMGYRGARGQTLSKLEFGKRLAACLATLLISQQDSAGLATFDTQLRSLIPPRSSPKHLQVLFESLLRAQPGSETKLSAALEQSTSQLKRRGVLLLISDCFDDVGALLTALRYFRHTGSEVVLFQTWDRDELEFPFQQRTQFRSLEKPGHERLIDPRTLRSAYLKKLADYRHGLSLGCARERIELIECVTDEDYAAVLRRFLSSRNRRGLGGNGLSGLGQGASGQGSRGNGGVHRGDGGAGR